MTKKVLLLSSITATIIFSGCTKNEVIKTEPKMNKLSFSEVKVPVKEYEKRKISATNKMTLNGKDYKIGFNTILRSGDRVGDGVYGMIFDSEGQPIYSKDGAIKVSNSNDFSSLLPIGKKLFMVSPDFRDKTHKSILQNIDNLFLDFRWIYRNYFIFNFYSNYMFNNFS